MGFQNCMDALNLKMPNKVPRTEYSANGHWELVKAVTGIDVNFESDADLKLKAAIAFEKEWDYGFAWSVLTHSNIFNNKKTSMGHAVFAAGGTDYNNKVYCPFKDSDDVFSLDMFETYGKKDIATLTKEYDDFYDLRCSMHPHSVNMPGIYVTLISGMLEILGWDMLLESMGDDLEEFGAFTNRYAEWITQYTTALANSKAEVVMIHDDIVWTAGPFVNPSWYREYVFPNYEKMFEPLHKAGKKIMYTSDGNFNEFVDDVAAVGVNAFVMEPTTDMEYIAKKFGKTHAFVGNADTRILTMGTKDEIQKEVERCFNIGRDCPGFIFATGNHIPSNVPVENALWYNECYEKLAYRR